MTFYLGRERDQEETQANPGRAETGRQVRRLVP
jgi:hypothetical protein